MNSYWGGAVAASAGCLVFGSLPRLGELAQPGAVVLGAGLGIHMLARPFESVLLALCVLLYFAPVLIQRVEWRRLARVTMIALLAARRPWVDAIAGPGGDGKLDHTSVSLSHYQYGVPAAFTVQPQPVPHRALTHEQAIDCPAQRLAHGEGTDSFAVTSRGCHF